MDLFESFPAKFPKNRGHVFATWRNGESLHPPQVTALLRSAATANGRNPTSFSIHSLRGGGATALYRATMDIDLVATFVRWKTQSISAYLWGNHQMVDGLSDFMVAGGHTVHNATNFPKNRHENGPDAIPPDHLRADGVF